MCVACGVTPIPVCSVTGACGGVSLIAQIVVLTSLSVTIAMATAQLWLQTVRVRFGRVMGFKFTK